jgi:hypothetical protein
MARKITIIRGAIAPDHVHMLISAPPSLAPSKIVQYLKDRSSRKLQGEYEALSDDLHQMQIGEAFVNGMSNEGFPGTTCTYQQDRTEGRIATRLPICPVSLQVGGKQLDYLGLPGNPLEQGLYSIHRYLILICHMISPSKNTFVHTIILQSSKIGHSNGPSSILGT